MGGIDAKPAEREVDWNSPRGVWFPNFSAELFGFSSRAVVWRQYQYIRPTQRAAVSHVVY